MQTAQEIVTFLNPLLLAVVGYYLKSLVGRLDAVEKEIREFVVVTVRIEAKLAALEQRIQTLESRRR